MKRFSIDCKLKSLIKPLEILWMFHPTLVEIIIIQVDIIQISRHLFIASVRNNMAYKSLHTEGLNEMTDHKVEFITQV